MLMALARNYPFLVGCRSVSHRRIFYIKLLGQQICCYFIMSCQVMLWDKRLSIAELTEQQLKKNVEFEEEKRKMEMQIVHVELELKKEQLKQIKNWNNNSVL
jgi:hypothetical protein